MAKPLTASQKAAVAAEKARQAAAAAKKNKPKPAPSAGRRTNPKAAKPKSPAAKPALPPGRQGGPLATRPGTRPSLPPGRQGGALATQGNAKPENPRRTNARNRQATAGRGTTGPGRVGQPAGSANRIYGANVVNNSVNRAIAFTRLARLGKVAGRVAVPAAIASQLADIKGGFEKLANHPFMKNLGKGTPTGTQSGRTGRGGTTADKAKPTFNEKAYASQQKFAVPKSKPPSKPKPPVAATPTRSSTPSRSSAPASRPAASAPARTPSRPAASRPSTPKPPSAPSAPKVAGTSGIGPVKSGAEYASKKGSIAESVRQLREMRAASSRRQTGQAAPALSSSKDYPSSFKDMKGGSSRFAAELKKKKRG